MSDLISRQAAIDAVHYEFDECLVWDESGQTTANEVESILDYLPTIDAVPVVHGYWKETKQPCGWDEIDCATCSVCGEDYPLGDYGIEDFNELSHYCSNCGAKMDGERKQE